MEVERIFVLCPQGHVFPTTLFGCGAYLQAFVCPTCWQLYPLNFRRIQYKATIGVPDWYHLDLARQWPAELPKPWAERSVARIASSPQRC